MSKIEIVKKNLEIQHVFEKGHSFYGRYIVVYFLPNVLNQHRFAFCVGKKLGKAVVRNHLKRLLREAVRSFHFIGQDISYDFILVARSSILNKSLMHIVEDLKHIFAKARVITLEKKGD